MAGISAAWPVFYC